MKQPTEEKRERTGRKEADQTGTYPGNEEHSNAYVYVEMLLRG